MDAVDSDPGIGYIIDNGTRRTSRRSVKWRVFCYAKGDEMDTTNTNEIEVFHLNTGECKPFLTHEEQLDLLIKRGLVVNDRQTALNILQRTNYYRFSAYSLSLRKDDVFDSAVTFDNIYELYRFDDAFRLLILKYAGYVEIAFRAYIAYTHSKNYGPLGYMEPENFSNADHHATFIAHLEDNVKRADEFFVRHHKEQKDGVFPLWAAIECCTFGETSKLYKNLNNTDKQEICDRWSRGYIGYADNWLHCCVVARNTAAHGSRFYNRRFQRVRIWLPKKLKKRMATNTPFSFAFAILKLLPTRDLAVNFIKELSEIFTKYPFALEEKMGFPEDWDTLLKEQISPSLYSYRNTMKENLPESIMEG